MMQAASNEAADKVERAFLQVLLMSLDSNNKEVSDWFSSGIFGLELQANRLYALGACPCCLVSLCDVAFKVGDYGIIWKELVVKTRCESNFTKF